MSRRDKRPFSVRLSKYKKKLARQRGQNDYIDLLAEIEQKRKKEACWDPQSDEWRAHVKAALEEKLASAKLTPLQKEKLMNLNMKYAHVYHDQGSPFPRVKNVEANIKLKHDAKTKVAQPY